MIKCIYPEINCMPLSVEKTWKNTSLHNLKKMIANKHGIRCYLIDSKARDEYLVKIRAEFIEEALKITKSKTTIMNCINRDSTTFYNYQKTWLK